MQQQWSLVNYRRARQNDVYLTPEKVFFSPIDFAEVNLLGSIYEPLPLKKEAIPFSLASTAARPSFFPHCESCDETAAAAVASNQQLIYISLSLSSSSSPSTRKSFHQFALRLQDGKRTLFNSWKKRRVRVRCAFASLKWSYEDVPPTSHLQAIIPIPGVFYCLCSSEVLECRTSTPTSLYIFANSKWDLLPSFFLATCELIFPWCED